MATRPWRGTVSLPAAVWLSGVFCAVIHSAVTDTIRFRNLEPRDRRVPMTPTWTAPTRVHTSARAPANARCDPARCGRRHEPYDAREHPDLEPVRRFPRERLEQLGHRVLQRGNRHHRLHHHRQDANAAPDREGPPFLESDAGAAAKDQRVAEEAWQ